MSNRRILTPLRALALAGAGAAAVFAFAPQTAPVKTLVAPEALAQSGPVTPVPGAPVTFADIVERVSPAVVSVDVRVRGMAGINNTIPGFDNLPDDHPFHRFFREFEERFGQGQPRRGPEFGRSQGSGFFISADGYIVTNNHVVENAEEVTVRMHDGTEHTADVIGTDSRTDLAVLKINDNGAFPYVEFADADVRVGDWVLAVGNPFGLGGSVTAGIVSARGRDIGAGPYDDFIQIDAPVNRGNSGGPAFDMNGRVIGVNTAIFSPSGGNVGIAFAIPAATVRGVIDQLRDGGTVVRGWLGVQIQPVSEEIADSLGLDEPYGAIVTQLMDESPAGSAGIERGDTIIAVDGERIDDARDLARTIGGMEPGYRVEVTVWRDGRERDIVVELGTLPDSPQLASAPDVAPEDEQLDVGEALGLSLAPGSQGGVEGVVVVDVEPTSEAAEKGLSAGDIILEVAGLPVSTPGEVAAAVQDARDDDRGAVLMLIQSGDNTRFIAIGIDQG